MSRTASATAADRARQVFVTASYLLGIVGVLFGVGVLGTRVEESPGGDLSDDATLMAPHGPAFSIWSLIYVLLTAYVIWQWLPAQAADERHRRIGWLAAVSIVLNAAWLLVTQQGWIWGSLAVIVVLALVLIAIMAQLHSATRTTTQQTWLDTVAVDVTFGLYLGWVLAATGANLGAGLASSDMEPGRWTSVGLVVAVTLVGAALLRLFSGQLSIAAALGWGLFWIAYGRLFDEPADTVVGIVAAGCLIVILGVAALSQGRRAQIR
ncbi:MAG: TspO/MBR family protein [Actinomycetia bacterium]|nr:TspO/MBR family protein [Actinomycetes bacterium]